MPWLGRPQSPKSTGDAGARASSRCDARLGPRSLDPGRVLLDESARAPRADGCDPLVADPVVRGAPARAPKRSWAVDPAAAAAQADSARSPDDEVLRRLDALTLRRVFERLEKIPEQAYKSVAADLLGGDRRGRVPAFPDRPPGGRKTRELTRGLPGREQARPGATSQSHRHRLRQEQARHALSHQDRRWTQLSRRCSRRRRRATSRARWPSARPTSCRTSTLRSDGNSTATTS